MKQPLLELKNLVRTFPSGDEDIVILKSLNLTIYTGEMVAVVGQSGSGKSTLMNILGCLDQPSSGSYRIAGKEVSSLDSDELARLRREHFGFIFQRYHLMGNLTAAGNVEVPAVYAGVAHTERHQRALTLLTRLGLENRSDYYPSQLSGGQQQRVSIARALVNGGQVILADEPTGALDSKSGQEVMQILEELHQVGHTVILVTHDMDIACHAERIVEIRDGNIIRDSANPDAPQHDATAEIQETSLLSAKRVTGRWWSSGQFTEAFKMAWLAMVSHRMRTLLTMLGIIIGITSVVSIVALGQGTKQKVIDDISAIGTNTITVFPGKDWGDDKAGTIRTLVPADAQAISEQFFVDSVTPEVGTSVVLRYGNIKLSGSIQGVGNQYFRVKGIKLVQGVVFNSDDLLRQAQVVVIDHNTRKKLFPYEQNVIGKVILLGALPCTVIGVTEENKSSFGMSENLQVWVPYTTAMSRLLGQQYLSNITVRIKDGVDTQVAETVLIKQLTTRHRTKDFFTSNSDSIMQTVEKTTGTLTLMISSIAVISLIVGGIGVMNIMLVSVTERTREIGIRMAVGARQSDILQQFLIEAVLVCLLGGAIGIMLSFGIGLLFNSVVTDFAMSFSASSIIAAVLCSSMIGVVFGYLPAKNAAKLNPIDALARE